VAVECDDFQIAVLINWVEYKLRLSHCRRGQAQRVPGGRGSQNSRQSAHEGGKVVSHTHRPCLPPRKYSWYSFLLEAESTPGGSNIRNTKYNGVSAVKCHLMYALYFLKITYLNLLKPSGNFTYYPV
jgi:hypothetical protein